MKGQLLFLSFRVRGAILIFGIMILNCLVAVWLQKQVKTYQKSIKRHLPKVA